MLCNYICSSAARIFMMPWQTEKQFTMESASSDSSRGKMFSDSVSLTSFDYAEDLDAACDSSLITCSFASATRSVSRTLIEFPLLEALAWDRRAPLRCLHDRAIKHSNVATSRLLSRGWADATASSLSRLVRHAAAEFPPDHDLDCALIVLMCLCDLKSRFESGRLVSTYREMFVHNCSKTGIHQC